MRLILRAASLAMAVGLAFASDARADDSCTPATAGASVELGTLSGGTVFVPAEIAAHRENLLVETTAPVSVISDSVASALGLPREHVSYRETLKVNRERVTEYADAESIGFGGLAASNVRLAVVSDDKMAPDVAGVLGADVLRQFSVEFDFGRGRFVVYAQGPCPPVWTRSAATPPTKVEKDGRVFINAELDGKKVTAVLNTGAPFSVANFALTKNLSEWNLQTAGLKVLHSVDGKPDAYRFPCKELSFYGVSMLNPPIVLRTGTFQLPELILGQDILRRLHLYIDYGRGRLYVAPASAQ
ncbi:MAG TPA: retroviral-like aspartic protease family protein [Rhizomicrobium sp.]